MSTTTDALTRDELEGVVAGYLECAGWLVNDHEAASEEERERGYEGDHRGGPFDEASYARARETVAELVAALEDPGDIGAYLERIGHARDGSTPAERFGHDLWLTRNGHGAGYWDRGLGELGERLSDAARSLGEAYACVADDDDETVHVGA